MESRNSAVFCRNAGIARYDGKDVVSLGNLFGAYEEIYKKVCDDMKTLDFDSESLFDHCMQTCSQLFAIAEYREGKAAINLPDGVLEDIAKLYDTKYGTIPGNSMPREKYDYATSWKNFSEEKFSMQDLASMNRPPGYSPKAPDNPAKDEIRQIYQRHLPAYFGYTYEQTAPPQQRYEIIRMAKILYDCKIECGVSLGALGRASLLKFRADVPSAYRKAIRFIQMRMVMRNRDSDFHISFQNIMELERYKNATQSFLVSFPIKSVEHILSYIKRPSCKAVRFVSKKVYQTVLETLRSSKTGQPQNFDTPEAIQCYAYVYFLMTDMVSAAQSTGQAKNAPFDLEIKDEEYDAIERFCESCRVSGNRVEDIGAFAASHRRELLPVVFPDIQAPNTRKYSERMERHKSNYDILSGIYNRGRNQEESAPITTREAVLLIRLYEYLENTGCDIPLYSGYSGRKRKSQKIKKLLKKMEAFMRNHPIQEPLDEEEFFLASCWLFDRMIMLIHTMPDTGNPVIDGRNAADTADLLAGSDSLADGRRISCSAR